MRIQFNAPVVLIYALISTFVLGIEYMMSRESEHQAIMKFFTLFPSFSWSDPLSYLRLFTHVIGHISWEHLLSNFSFILLIGPILEEKYGSLDLLFMILVTALITAILQILFFENALLGASGIVFMMILLSSFTNTEQGSIPLTFILVAIIFLGREIVGIFGEDNISQFAHIIGGICGAGFGFILTRRKKGNDGLDGPSDEIEPNDDFDPLAPVEAV